VIPARLLPLLPLLSCAPPLSGALTLPADARVAAPRPEPSPRIAVHRTVEHYTLEGRTARELALDLHAKRPRPERFTGWTRWRLRWRFEPRPGPATCRPGTVSVDLDLTTVLPAWTPPPDADPELPGAFQDYLEALTHHEAGHAELAETSARRLGEALRALPPMEDCDALRARAQAVGEAEVAWLREANATFDHHTDHGATQGAIFPRPSDPAG
jgi:predicted secreted Zn-dependent protease